MAALVKREQSQAKNHWEGRMGMRLWALLILLAALLSCAWDMMVEAPHCLVALDGAQRAQQV